MEFDVVRHPSQRNLLLSGLKQHHVGFQLKPSDDMIPETTFHSFNKAITAVCAMQAYGGGGEGGGVGCWAYRVNELKHAGAQL